MIPVQAPNEPIRAPRGTSLSCKGWHRKAMRMLINNLDPEVDPKRIEKRVKIGYCEVMTTP